MMSVGEGNRVYESYLSTGGPKLNTDAWVVFLGMLTGSQHCTAFLHSVSYSTTPTVSPLWRRQLLPASFYRSGTEGSEK